VRCIHSGTFAHDFEKPRTKNVHCSSLFKLPSSRRSNSQSRILSSSPFLPLDTSSCNVCIIQGITRTRRCKLIHRWLYSSCWKLVSLSFIQSFDGSILLGLQMIPIRISVSSHASIPNCAGQLYLGPDGTVHRCTSLECYFIRYINP
jgi:hypothetical protein